MSDAIGGGGGGSDPFAMFQQILDPLGLFKGLGGGIDKILKGGDASQISEVGQKVLNHASMFQQQQGAGGPADDIAGNTEYVPPQAEPSQGYSEGHEGAGGAQNLAPQSISSQQASVQMSTAQSTSAQNNTSKLIDGMLNQTTLGQSSDGQKTAKEKEREMLENLQTVSADFLAFDTQGWDRGGVGDCKFDRLNLKNVANDPNYPKALRDAATYLLEHPALYNELSMASGGGTGMITKTVLDEFIKRLVDHSSGKSPVPDDKKTTDTHDDKVPGGVDPTQGGKTPGANQTDDGSKNEDKDYSGRTLMDKLQKTGQSLEDKQDELIKLLNKPEEQQTSAEKARIKVLDLEIQRTTDRFRMLHDLISNLSKAFHDMSMHSIGNIR